jgi:hypothetical protein
MELDEIKKLATRKPFRPFKMQTTLNAQSFTVLRPETLMLEKPGLVVFFDDEDKQLHLIDLDTINVLSIT